MALQIWLPLNGNINNIGVDPVAFTGSNTYSDYGKMGKSSSGTVSGTSTTLAPTDGFSFGLWWKITSADTYSLQIPINNNKSLFVSKMNYESSNGSWALKLYATANQPQMIWAYDTRMSSGSGTWVLGEWNHFFYTIDTSSSTMKVKMYINGVHCHSYSSSEFALRLAPGSIILGGTALANDFRLYDHCLSLKEIREVYKGLCAHYLLDGSRERPNLITSMTAGSRMTANGNYSLIGDFSQNADTYAYFNVSPDLVLDTEYTLSFDVSNFPNGGIWNWQLWNDGDYAFTVNGDGHYSYTFTPTASKLPSGYSLTKFLFDDGARTNPAGQVTFSNFKIEKGSGESAWCPHSSDSAYSLYNTTKEYDTSGFGQHGTIIGEVTAASDSPRNGASSVFDGSTSGISLPILDLMKGVLSNQCTINFWVNEADISNRSVYFGGYSGSPFNIEMSSGRLRIYWGASPDLYYSSISNDVWAMITIVIDVATGIKTYKDGQLIGTHAAALGDIASSFTSNFWLGKDYRDGTTMMEGKMSDFRIYATALNQEDITSLYKTSLAVDDQGNSYSGQFDEIKKSKFSTGNGMTYSSLSELDSSGMEVKVLDDGSIWGRIHYLDVSSDITFFSNDAEVANCIDKENRFSLMGRVEDFGKQVVLTNMFPAMTEAGFKTGTFDSTYRNHSNSSLKIDGSTTASEVTSSTTQTFALDNTHKYYARMEILQETINGSSQIYWPIAEPSMFSLAATKAKTWTKVSVVKDRASFTNGNYPLRVDYDCSKNGGTMWFDGVMLIDLTEAFGAGFEPTKAWCDENIPYFLGTKVIDIESLDSFNFEFMLTYPSLSTTLYNRWKQSITPNSSYVTSADGTGYRAITTAWSTYAAPITKSSSSGSSLYSCNYTSNWWAPIGQKTGFSNGIPAANGSTQKSTELWVRIYPNILNKTNARIYTNSISSNNFYER